MNCEELLALTYGRNVEILLHLPEYEGMQFIMVGGAITSQARFDAFEDSFCHLMEDGRIMRYRRQIGSFADIEVLNIIDAEVVEAAEQNAHPTPPTSRTEIALGMADLVLKKNARKSAGG